MDTSSNETLSLKGYVFSGKRKARSMTVRNGVCQRCEKMHIFRREGEKSTVSVSERTFRLFVVGGRCL